ncbi:Thioesterase/thiol ester dehydrase-isomerase, partial [Sarocladium strictum]
STSDLKNTFRSIGPLWHPPGGRGLYGGCVISQSLAAAQRTVDYGFACHSVQSSFLHLGSAESPITYSVERLREGRSYVTRSVQAVQDGACLYTAVLSFATELYKPGDQVSHALTSPLVEVPDCKSTRTMEERATAGLAPELLPISLERAGIPPQDRVVRCWIRAPERLCQADNRTTHQAILAYLSDWIAISAVSYIYGQFRFPEAITISFSSSPLPGTNIGMLSTLNHALYFHATPSIRADEWMLLEASSPWAGDERCIAQGKMFSQDGILLATYIQEGVYRLKQDASRLPSNL